MRAGERDAGSAPTEFVLVGALVTLLFLAVLQSAVALHVRNVLAAAVADGARYAANADVADPAAGAARANELIRRSLTPAFARAVAAPDAGVVDGAPVVTVTVRARLPLLAWFLPIGPEVSASGHAVVEPR
jgi:hypothetical protein